MSSPTRAALLVVFLAGAIVPLTAAIPGELPLIRGTVSHVDPTSQIIEVGHGTWRIDATTAVIRDRAGNVASITAIVTGSEITAIGRNTLPLPENAPFRALAITIDDPEVVIVSGRVEQVQRETGTFRLLGKWYSVTNETVFVLGPITGFIRPSFDEILQGRIVTVEAVPGTSPIPVRRISATEPPSDASVTDGVITEIVGDLWTIAASDGRTLRLRVTPRTLIEGNPVPNDRVRVTLLSGGADTIPLTITRVESNGGNFVVTIGEVLALTPTSITVNGGSTNNTYVIDQHTVVTGGQLAVGAEVEAHGQLMPDGTLIAQRIVVLRPPQVVTPPKISILGQVTARDGRSWRVGVWRVEVSPLAVIAGDPRLGDLVYVEGLRIGADAVTAVFIGKR